MFKYSCNKGFSLVGDDLVHCDNGDWSLTSPPLCVSRGCPPPVVDHDDHLVEKVVHGGGVYEYLCEDKTQLVGSRTLVCQGGRYNDTPPVCVSSPTQVTVNGPEVVSVSSRSTFSCVTNIGQEPGHLTWRLEDSLGRDVTGYIVDTTSSVSQVEDGIVTKSEAFVEIEETINGLVVECVNQDEVYSARSKMEIEIHCKLINIK